MNEIRTNNEVVTLKDAKEYFDKLTKKVGLQLDHFGSTKYVNSFIRSSFHYDSEEPYMKVEAVCGIRMMGDLSAEDMFEAGEEIKAIAKVVETFNDRMSEVKIAIM